MATPLLSVANWRASKAFCAMTKKITQKKYYESKGAAPEVMQLVELDSKPFGSEAEKILVEILGLGPRTSTQNDATLNGTKIEIKSARYWAGKDDCKWQHLEPDHDYQVVLFALLDFQGWNLWAMKKERVMGEMRDKKIVTFQGKQGWWCTKSQVLSYLAPIHSKEDLVAFIA
jgi:hypothetical protein